MNLTLNPQIKILLEKKLIGMNLKMSLAENTTGLLWRSLMPRRKEITNSIGIDLYSIQVYDSRYSIKNISINAPFYKWACVEVTGFEHIPEGMQSFILPEGLYAVFHYKGDVSQAETVFRYIFGEWLPSSEYELDLRPHFEILGGKYKNNHPDSEEDIWIPIKIKN